MYKIFNLFCIYIIINMGMQDAKRVKTNMKICERDLVISERDLVPSEVGRVVRACACVYVCVHMLQLKETWFPVK